MATTTTNFGWDIPQSTDLVKDGATAIAALGQDIDTAFVDFKGGTTGQVLKKTSGTDLDVEWGTPSSGLTLINTTSFSAVASQQINACFSTTYDNYRIIIKIASMVGGQDDLIGLQFGTNTTLNTNTNYRRNILEIGTNGVVTAINATDNQNRLFIGQMNVYGQIIVDVGSPFLSERTWIRATCDTSDRAIQFATGFFDNTTSFTDFAFIKDAATSITGTVSVYGYAK